MNPRASLGVAGEWVHHVAAISVTTSTGGTLTTAAYLTAYVLPAYVSRPPRWARLCSPVAFLAVASMPRSPGMLIAAGLFAGIGRAAAGRPSAWLAGLERVSGLPAIIGAGLGAALVSSSAVSGYVVAAAFVSVSGSEETERTGPAGPLVPAVIGVAVIVGMRVLEPVFLNDPIGGAAFALAWAAGAGVGARWARHPDPRAVSAAPFIGAAAIAMLGTVEGPGMLFLWSVVGMSAALVGGAAPRIEGRGRRLLPLGVVAVSAAVAASGLFTQLLSALWFGAASLLLGGFVTLAALARAGRRIPSAASEDGVPDEGVLMEAAESAQEVAEPATGVPLEPSPEEAISPQSITAAAAELLEALKTARTIRGGALQELRMSIDPLGDLRGRTASSLAELAEAVDAAKRGLSEIA